LSNGVESCNHPASLVKVYSDGQCISRMHDDLSFSPASFFVFRTPLLPFDLLVRFSLDCQSSFKALHDEQFQKIYAEDLARARASLKVVINRPEVWEAIFLACPGFVRLLGAWEADPDSKRGKRAEVTLVRYVARLAGRTTPFGLLAGISHGAIGGGTCLNVLGSEKYVRHTQISVEFAMALCEEWHRDSELKMHLQYRPNSSLYHLPGWVRYVETRQKDQEPSHRLVGLHETEILRQALSLASGGATSKQLVQQVARNGFTWEAACDYVDKLIECQVLRPDLEVRITGQRTVQYLANHLPKTKKFANIRASLRQISSALAIIDKSGFSHGQTHYREVLTSLASLRHRPTRASPFHVTLVKPAPEASLGQEVLAEITRGINIFHHLYQNDRSTDPALAAYFQEFAARYGDREVPLVEALDGDIGIPYEFNAEVSRHFGREKGGTERSSSILLLRKLSEALGFQAQEIVFNEQELKCLKSTKSLPLPDSFAVKAVLTSSSQQNLVRGQFQVILEGGFGSSGAGMFARFCQSDKSLLEKVSAYLQAEEAQRPEAVFAEIVHLPGEHYGDLVIRPLLRKYEIPYLGKSGATRSRQLPITDLLLSARGGRFLLRSRTLGREVIARMTGAHYFPTSDLNVYRFLCSLQHQGVAGRLWWDWGLLADAPFLPRVSSGRLILCLARWRIGREEIAQFSSLTGADQFRFIQEWRVRRRIPRWAAIRGENQNLPVDFCNPLSVKSFVHLLKHYNEGALQEFFPAPDALSARGPEGSFVHDLVIPFLAKTPPSNAQYLQVMTSRRSARRSVPLRVFPPFSKWMYVKLYMGPSMADTVLRERIAPLVMKSLREGVIDRWFFLRYRDPEVHLRLRFQGSRQRLLNRFLPLVQAEIDSLIETNRAWRVQYDTYERETERYGGDLGIPLAEQIFHFDSQAVLQIIGSLEPNDEGLNDRWRLALRGVDMLLTGFGYRTKAKQQLVQMARVKFLGRIAQDDESSSYRRSLHFRKERPILESILDDDSAKNGVHLRNSMVSCLRILRERSIRLAPTVLQFKDLDRKRKLSVPLSDLALSFVHMHLNRLLRWGMSPGEDEIYDSLERLYISRMARLG